MRSDDFSPIGQQLQLMQQMWDDKRQWEEEYRLMFAPRLCDMACVARLAEALRRSGVTDPDTVQGRKVFIFLVLWYYAPQSLFGRRMPNFLRMAMRQALGVQRISQFVPNLVFEYCHYADFRHEVDAAAAALDRSG